MPANFDVYYDFGGADGGAGITELDTDSLTPSLRFKRADDGTIDLNDPMTIPTAGTNYSRWKQIYLKCTTTAPDTQVDNVRFFTDAGDFGTGITVNVGTSFPTKNSGSNAGYEIADVEDQAMLTPGHGGVSAIADAFSFTTGAPLSGPSISETSSIIDATDEMTDYLVLQMEVISTASPGDLTNETFTFRYDEI